MLSRCGLLLRLRSSLSTSATARAAFPVIMDLNHVAIVKHVDGEDKFTFSFHLRREDLQLDRQFNMSRPLSEPSKQFLDRLNFNVEKAASKKNKKKSKAQPEEVKVVSVNRFADFKTVSGDKLELDEAESIKDVLFREGIVLDVLGQVFTVRVNPPIVDCLKLPDVIMADFQVYPAKINVLFADQADALFEWFVSDKVLTETAPNTAHLKWIARGKGFFFVPSSDDIGRHLKIVCTPRRVSSSGEVTPGNQQEAISKGLINAGPGFCPFEARHAFTSALAPDDQLRVLTYNLLADLYADSEYSRTQLFPWCPPYALDIEYRKQLTVKELLGYNADLVCLQEVDQKIFKYDLLPVLTAKGFKGVFDQKGGQVSEGVSCFWRTSKLSLVAQSRLVLSEGLASLPHFEDIYNCIKTNEALRQSVMARTTTLQVAILRSKLLPRRGLIVGTTHLYFHPTADHIRLLQVGLCVRHLEHVLGQQRQADPDTDYAVFLCGDFNSSPPFGVFEFIRQGLIEPAHADWNSCEGQKVEGLTLRHSMKMDSACGTPKYTNFTAAFADCLDYIFYETDKFSVQQVVPFPSEEELNMHTAIPNIVFPSDHVACIADLKWKESSTTTTTTGF